MSLWIGPPPVLASASETRLRLLRAAGIPAEPEGSGVDERAVEAGHATPLPPEAAAALLAREKALAVSRRRPGRLVVGADQTLALDGRRFDKPATPDEAEAQLGRLAGRAHALHSAAALALDGRIVHEAAEAARLLMRPLDEAAIGAYVAAAGDAALASVGAYQLEGLGIHLFSEIAGDHSTILGLPLLPLLARLRDRGLLGF